MPGIGDISEGMKVEAKKGQDQQKRSSKDERREKEKATASVLELK